MNNRLGELKKAIRAFFPNYTTEGLTAYLAHAQDGKVFYNSCCCFIGGATADHALQGRCDTNDYSHYRTAKNLRGAAEAEAAFFDLGRPYYKYTIGTDGVKDDAQRRRVLIPMIRAELRRRAQQADRSTGLCFSGSRSRDALDRSVILAKDTSGSIPRDEIISS
jgi:hypothetical protein